MNMSKSRDIQAKMPSPKVIFYAFWLVTVKVLNSYKKNYNTADNEAVATRACLKNHFRNLQAPLCGIFYPYSVAVARYAALIRIKFPTNWDSQLTKSLFQTRSSLFRLR